MMLLNRTQTPPTVIRILKNMPCFETKNVSCSWPLIWKSAPKQSPLVPWLFDWLQQISTSSFVGGRCWYILLVQAYLKVFIEIDFLNQTFLGEKPPILILIINSPVFHIDRASTGVKQLQHNGRLRCQAPCKLHITYC